MMQFLQELFHILNRGSMAAHILVEAILILIPMKKQLSKHGLSRENPMMMVQDVLFQRLLLIQKIYFLFITQRVKAAHVMVVSQ